MVVNDKFNVNLACGLYRIVGYQSGMVLA